MTGAAFVSTVEKLLTAGQYRPLTQTVLTCPWSRSIAIRSGPVLLTAGMSARALGRGVGVGGVLAVVAAITLPACNHAGALLVRALPLVGVDRVGHVNAPPSSSPTRRLARIVCRSGSTRRAPSAAAGPPARPRSRARASVY